MLLLLKRLIAVFLSYLRITTVTVIDHDMAICCSVRLLSHIEDVILLSHMWQLIHSFIHQRTDLGGMSKWLHVHLTMGASRHGQRGSKMLSRPIIYALFSVFRRLLWASPPHPHLGSTPGLCWGTFVSRSLICPPLEKILWVPMHLTT